MTLPLLMSATPLDRRWPACGRSAYRERPARRTRCALERHGAEHERELVDLRVDEPAEIEVFHDVDAVLDQELLVIRREQSRIRPRDRLNAPVVGADEHDLLADDPVAGRGAQSRHAAVELVVVGLPEL